MTVHRLAHEFTAGTALAYPPLVVRMTDVDASGEAVIAHLLVDQYGDEAPMVVADRAIDDLASGNYVGVTVWTRIMPIVMRLVG